MASLEGVAGRAGCSGPPACCRFAGYFVVPVPVEPLAGAGDVTGALVEPLAAPSSRRHFSFSVPSIESQRAAPLAAPVDGLVVDELAPAPAEPVLEVAPGEVPLGDVVLVPPLVVPDALPEEPLCSVVLDELAPVEPLVCAKAAAEKARTVAAVAAPKILNM